MKGKYKLGDFWFIFVWIFLAIFWLPQISIYIAIGVAVVLGIYVYYKLMKFHIEQQKNKTLKRGGKK